MKVLCCYTSLRQATYEALQLYVDKVDYVDVHGDDFGYWRAINERWNGKEDLVTVEHDNEIHDTVMTQFRDCSEDWCVFPYKVFASHTCAVGLGCSKFSARLQQEVSLDVLTERFGRCEDCHGKGCWWHLDGPLLDLITSSGRVPHVHSPEIKHHHEYASETEDVIQARRKLRYKSPLSLCQLTDPASWPQLCDVCDNLPDEKTGCIRYSDWCAYPVDWDEAIGIITGYLVRKQGEIMGTITMKFSGEYEIDYKDFYGVYENYSRSFADFSQKCNETLPYNALVTMAGGNV